MLYAIVLYGCIWCLPFCDGVRRVSNQFNAVRTTTSSIMVDVWCLMWRWHLADEAYSTILEREYERRKKRRERTGTHLRGTSDDPPMATGDSSFWRGRVLVHIYIFHFVLWYRSIPNTDWCSGPLPLVCLLNKHSHVASRSGVSSGGGILTKLRKDIIRSNNADGFMVCTESRIQENTTVNVQYVEHHCSVARWNSTYCGPLRTLPHPIVDY